MEGAREVVEGVGVAESSEAKRRKREKAVLYAFRAGRGSSGDIFS